MNKGFIYFNKQVHQTCHHILLCPKDVHTSLSVCSSSLNSHNGIQHWRKDRREQNCFINAFSFVPYRAVQTVHSKFPSCFSQEATVRSASFSPPLSKFGGISTIYQISSSLLTILSEQSAISHSWDGCFSLWMLQARDTGTLFASVLQSWRPDFKPQQQMQT